MAASLLFPNRASRHVGPVSNDCACTVPMASFHKYDVPPVRRRFLYTLLFSHFHFACPHFLAWSFVAPVGPDCFCIPAIQPLTISCNHAAALVHARTDRLKPLLALSLAPPGCFSLKRSRGVLLLRETYFDGPPSLHARQEDIIAVSRANSA